MVDEPMFPDLAGAPEVSADESQNQAAPPAPIAETVTPELNQVSITPMTSDPEIPTPDLFQDAPSSMPGASSGMVDAVVSTEDAKQTKILGPKPKTSSGLDVGAHRFNLGGLLLKISLVVGVLVYGYVYAQFNNTFEVLSKNPTQTLVSFESSFESEQTEINLYNLLMAKFALDDFVGKADSFLLKWAQYQSEYTANNIREDLTQDLGRLQQEMKKSLQTTKDLISNPLYPRFLATSGRYNIDELESKYIQLLKERIRDEKIAIAHQDDEESAQFERANFNSAQAIADDKAFRRELVALNLDEQLTPDVIESLFNKATQTNKNLFSTILSIKNSRVHWPKVILELDRVTKKVDPLYGTNIQSNIDYSNLAVNASDRTISIRGETRTDDSRNFTLLSNLIDNLEKSPLFADVSNRTFSKSDEQGGDATSSFSLNFSLQADEDPRDDTTAIAGSDGEVPFPELAAMYGAFEDAEEEAVVVTETAGDEYVTDLSEFKPLEEAESTVSGEDFAEIQNIELTPEQLAEFEAALNEMSIEDLEAAFDDAAESIGDGLTEAVTDVVDVPEEAVDESSPLGANIFNAIIRFFDASEDLQTNMLQSDIHIPRTPRNH